MQPGHVLRTVPGADAAAILVEAPVEDVVRRLDRPVPAIEGEEAFRGCGFRGQAGDTVGCLAAALAGLDLPGFAADSEDLSDAGEVEVVVEPALSEQTGLSLLAKSLSVQECKILSEISTVHPRSSGSL